MCLESSLRVGWRRDGDEAEERAAAVKMLAEQLQNRRRCCDSARVGDGRWNASLDRSSGRPHKVVLWSFNARGLRAVCRGYDGSRMSGTGEASIQTEDAVVGRVELCGVSARDDESDGAERDRAFFAQEMGELS